MDMKQISEHRRLAVLRHLAMAQGYTSNGSILSDVLQGVGIATTQDQMIATFAWLNEQELITLSGDADFFVVTATARGVDVAEGRAAHPGVKKPSPKA